MTHNMGPRLSGDHAVVRPTINLISNINTSVSAANGGQHQQTLLIFPRDIHPSANNQRPSRSPGTHREYTPTGRPPNFHETMPFKSTDKLGSEGNETNANCVYPGRLHALQRQAWYRKSDRKGKTRQTRTDKAAMIVHTLQS